MSPKRGPGLNDVTVGPDGALVATGFTTFYLSFFVVGGEDSSRLSARVHAAAANDQEYFLFTSRSDGEGFGHR